MGDMESQLANSCTKARLLGASPGGIQLIPWKSPKQPRLLLDKRLSSANCQQGPAVEDNTHTTRNRAGSYGETSSLCSRLFGVGLP